MPPGGRVLTTDQDQEATPPELLECSGVIPLQGSPDMVLKPPEIIPTSAACLGIHKGFSGCGKEPVRFISSSKRVHVLWTETQDAPKCTLSPPCSKPQSCLPHPRQYRKAEGNQLAILLPA